MSLSRRELLKKGSIFGLVGAFFGGKLPDTEHLEAAEPDKFVNYPVKITEPLMPDGTGVPMCTGEWLTPEYGQLLDGTVTYIEDAANVSAKGFGFYGGEFGASVNVGAEIADSTFIVPELPIKCITINTNFQLEQTFVLGQIDIYEEPDPISIDLEIEYEPQIASDSITYIKEKYTCTNKQWSVNKNDKPALKTAISIDGYKYSAFNFTKTKMQNNGVNAPLYQIHLEIDKDTTMDMDAFMVDSTTSVKMIKDGNFEETA